MSDLATYEARKRVRGSISLSIGMSLLAALIIWIYPSFSETFEGDELIDAYPEGVLQLFDVRTMASLEGFLAFELYVFGWIILLGLYLAYLAAGTVADDVDRGRMDVLLAMPISRARVVGETFAALAVPVLAVNLLTPVVLLVGSWMIDEQLSVADLVAVHALSIPYLLTCAAIGLVASVVFDRAGIAQRVALGVVFGLYMLESLLGGTDYEAVGAIAPMRYYDPNEVLLESTYDLVGAAVLVVATLALVGLAQFWFSRRDV